MKSNIQAALGFLAIFAVILFAIPAVSHYYGGALEAEAAENALAPFRIKILHSKELGAGGRYAAGEEVEMDLIAEVVISDGFSVSLPPNLCGGTLFFELKPED